MMSYQFTGFQLHRHLCKTSKKYEQINKQKYENINNVTDNQKMVFFSKYFKKCGSVIYPIDNVRNYIKEKISYKKIQKNKSKRNKNINGIKV